MDSLWDQMILNERKQKALSLGIRVCELEEQESLFSTLQESYIDDQKGIFINEHDEKDVKLGENSNFGFGKSDEFDDDLSDCEDKKGSSWTDSVKESNYELVINSSDQSFWSNLPNEIVESILIFLCDPDSLGYLSISSKSVFQASERVYKFICEKIYFNQTVKKKLNVENWGSWRNMLVRRPRLRVNGIYSLKTVFTKAPNNDAFWEEKKSEFIEVLIMFVFYSLRHVCRITN